MPESKKEYIWVVTGSTGEYSDKVDWNICAYRTEDDAKFHSEKAQAKANELHRKYEYHEMPSHANPWDLRMHADYTGTFYGYEMIEMRSLEALKDYIRKTNE